MRVIKTETNAYKFNELSEQSQEKALTKLWEINVDYEWWDSTYEDAKNIGLEIAEFDLDRRQYVGGKLFKDATDCADAIKKEHGEMCDTYKTADSFLKERDELVNTWPKTEDGDLDDEGGLDDALDKLESEFLQDLLEDYRIILTKEYEYLTSREAIMESMEANGYEFTEDGKLI